MKYDLFSFTTVLVTLNTGRVNLSEGNKYIIKQESIETMRTPFIFFSQNRKNNFGNCTGSFIGLMKPRDLESKEDNFVRLFLV